MKNYTTVQHVYAHVNNHRLVQCDGTPITSHTIDCRDYNSATVSQDCTVYAMKQHVHQTYKIRTQISALDKHRN